MDEQSSVDESAPAPSRLLPPNRVAELVRSAQFVQLLGVAESDQVDFKGYGYDMSNRKHVRELIADVASLANARGGVLVLGIGTVVHQAQRIEVATRRHHLLASPGVSAAACRRRARTWHSSDAAPRGERRRGIGCQDWLPMELAAR